MTQNPVIIQERKERRNLLLLLLLLSSDDLARGREMWMKYAPRRWRGLLSAGNASPSTAPAAGFWFNPAEARYGYGTRGYVPDDQIRLAVLAFLASAGDAMGRTVAQGPPWRTTVAEAVRDVQLAAMMVGRGGAKNVKDTDIATVQGVLGFQFARLERFAAQAGDFDADSPFIHRVPVNVGSYSAEVAARRAGNYARSALSTLDTMRRRAYADAGYQFERNILGAAEHCAYYPGAPRAACPDLTRLGWVSIGQLPPIGTRLCLWNCRCRMSFRRSIANVG